MIYRKFKDLDISMLGFGLMRLPVKEDGRIDEELTAEMVDYAMKHGVNYYDTAWPYHSG
ncbi:MAG: oxidoreductase, partial [Clostridiales bacterium]|nr:oxidoreductase [Clostridiales bacterium]